jgi:hypothetical protein
MPNQSKSEPADMPGWLAKALRRISERAAAREVLFTLKARRELASLEIGLDEEDACDILARLKTGDAAGRLKSAGTGEWMYLSSRSCPGRFCMSS